MRGLKYEHTFDLESFRLSLTEKISSDRLGNNHPAKPFCLVDYTFQNSGVYNPDSTLWSIERGTHEVCFENIYRSDRCPQLSNL